MNTDHLDELRESFRSAMRDWDVVVTAEYTQDSSFKDGYRADISFELWGKKLSGTFSLNGEWETLDDCPHSIDGPASVWIWIAMQFHKMIP